jgi:hypothetical protein
MAAGRGRDGRSGGARSYQPAVTFRAGRRLTGVLQDRPEDTRPWMLVFLVIAVVMIMAGVGWLAFGPPIR